MSIQLAHWTGDFGEAYTKRNQVDWRDRVASIDRLVPRDAESALEIGANKGHNVRALRAARPGMFVCGVEPAHYARRLAHRQFLPVVDGTAHAIPYEDASYDVVFCSGLLIHIAPQDLDGALRELHRVSSRWLLSIEYFSEQDTEVPYRDLPDMLWRRDYGAHWLRVFPGLRMLEVSDDVPGFDGARAWLLEKPQP